MWIWEIEFCAQTSQHYSEQDRDRKGSISLLRYNFQHENQQQMSRSVLKNYFTSVRNQNDGALTCILEVYIPWAPMGRNSIIQTNPDPDQISTLRWFRMRWWPFPSDGRRLKNANPATLCVFQLVMSFKYSDPRGHFAASQSSWQAAQPETCQWKARGTHTTTGH
jgi:hypothetical protein